ncbi:MAG: hypothetical protein WAL59_18200, partial [Roseiarcus sp.]
MSDLVCNRQTLQEAISIRPTRIHREISARCVVLCHVVGSGGDLPQGLEAEILAGVTWLESATQRNFGGGPRPLLVSVRSGAPISMPGMMDTVL